MKKGQEVGKRLRNTALGFMDTKYRQQSKIKYKKKKYLRKLSLVFAIKNAIGRK